MSFWNKKSDQNKEKYEFCIKEIAEIHLKISQIQGKIVLFETDLADLRGRINRKLAQKSDNPEPQKTSFETEREKFLNSVPLFKPFL